MLLIPIFALFALSSDPNVESFQQRLQIYLKVRQTAVANVPALPKKATPVQIDQRESALAEAIRKGRLDAKQGDILTPGLKPVFTNVFDTKAKKAAVKDGNPTHERVPGGVTPKIQVNAVYPKNAPLSTVPPTVLLRLPRLPKDIEYRFVGRTLILRDVQANMIIDFMPEVAPAR
jgi:hypothetical protein